MFGIFYLLFNGTMSGIAKTKQKIENKNAKERAKLNGNLTYYGENGERLVSNDRSVYRKTINGDDVLADLYTGEVYKNFSEEKRRKKEKMALEKGCTVIPIHYDELQDFNKKERYQLKTIMIKPECRDIDTKQFYIIVYINGLRFYMEIVTGLIVRLADNENPIKKWGDVSIEQIIDIVNERQELLGKQSKDCHNSAWWKEQFYLKNIQNLYMVNNESVFIIGKKTDENIKKIRDELRGECL